MNDSTGLSVDFVVNEFCSLQNANAELTPAQFFQSHAPATARQFVIDVVVADVRSRIKNGSVLDVEDYFGQFPELQQNDQAWRILEAAESRLIEQDGMEWKKQWKAAGVSGPLSPTEMLGWLERLVELRETVAESEDLKHRLEQTQENQKVAANALRSELKSVGEKALQTKLNRLVM